MGRDVAEETDMKTRPTTKLMRDGDLVAEVEVYLVDGDAGWTPYLSLDDAYKLDDVREALRSGDVDRAASHCQPGVPTDAPCVAARVAVFAALAYA